MLTFRFSDADGVMVESDTLTSGMTGKIVKLEFTSDWENRTKTAVFTAGPTTMDVLNVGEEVVIPHEVLQNYGDRLYVGIYGIAEDGTALPTIYARGPRISKGADPSGDESTQATPPVWAQLQAQIDELKQGGTGGGGGNDSGQNPTVATGDIASIKTVLGNLMTIIGAQVEDENCTPQGYNMDVSGLVAQNNTLIAALGTSDDSGGSGEDSGGDSGGGDAGTSDGVTSISHTVAAYDISDEPENGYMISTDTEHTAYVNKRPIPAWPLVGGKTYSITVSSLGENATGSTTNYFGLWVSTLNIVPVKGEVNAVTDTIVKNLVAWDGTATTKTYSCTAGDNEYLIFHANVLNLLMITAEVTA